MENHYFLIFLEATTLETRKSANHNGRSLFSCFFGVGNHYGVAFFGRQRPSKPENLQITTGDHNFLAFLEWEITIFLRFLKATTLETWKSANHNGRSLFSCFFGMENHYFLIFLEATTLETRKSANHNGRSLFSCFFGVGNHYGVAFFGRQRPSKPENLQITTGDHNFLAFLEWEITIFLRFLKATTLETWKSANHNGRSLFSCFFWRRRSPANKS